MTTKDIRRLNIKESTIKELFALSRNYCAFPDCNKNIITKDGTLLGEVCHIEAANELGQRFNSTMSNEERRHISNLILFCGNHHKITNDVEKYPVPTLQKIKKEHEEKAFRQLDELRKFAEIIDLTNNNTNQFPSSLTKLFNSLDIKPNTQDHQDFLNEYHNIFSRLNSLPDHMRQTLAIILKKMLDDPDSGDDWYQVTWITLKNECGGIAENELMERIKYLQQKDFIQFDDDEELRVTLNGFTKGNFLHWILDLSISENLDLNQIISKCDFSLLN